MFYIFLSDNVHNLKYLFEYNTLGVANVPHARTKGWNIQKYNAFQEIPSKIFSETPCSQSKFSLLATPPKNNFNY